MEHNARLRYPHAEDRPTSGPTERQHVGEHLDTWVRMTPRILLRTIFLTVLWLIVDEGGLSSLVVGIPLSLIASAVSVRLYPEPMPKIRPLGVLRFIRYFVVQSFLGGLDVASRAFRPSMPLDPANITYELRLPRMAPRILFLNTVSLLPGTLSSELAEDRLVVHVLDCSQPVLQDLAVLEERVADIFGVALRQHEEVSPWSG